MQIHISWLLQKPTDLDLHCLQNRVYPGSAGQELIESVDYDQMPHSVASDLGLRYLPVPLLWGAMLSTLVNIP